MKIKHNTWVLVLVILSLIPLVLAYINNGNSEYSNCYADIDSGEMICDDNSGNECVSGNDCSGDEICINGMCRAGESECVNYQGYGCSVDGNAWNDNGGGTCVSSNYGNCVYANVINMDCDENGKPTCEIGIDTANVVCQLPDTGKSCFSNSGGNFVQDGTCVAWGATNGCDTSGHVAKGLTLHQAACVSGLECDSSVLGGDYLRDGYCEGSQCILCKSNEVGYCDDGLDNDCDDLIDNGDNDCDGVKPHPIYR